MLAPFLQLFMSFTDVVWGVVVEDVKLERLKKNTIHASEQHLICWLAFSLSSMCRCFSLPFFKNIFICILRWKCSFLIFRFCAVSLFISTQYNEIGIEQLPTRINNCIDDLNVYKRDTDLVSTIFFWSNVWYTVKT